VVGALVQFDDTEEDFDLPPGSAGSTGWMAGPHATVRLSDNVFAQVRAAWGGSDNEIRSGAGEDHFDTDRWLVRGTLLGQWQSGPWQLRPRASVGYIEEDQESYVDTFGATVPSQTVTLGQAKAGSQIVYQHRMADGTLIEPGVLVEGIWNFHQEAQIILDDLVSGEEVRGRAEAGLTIVTFDGIAVGGSVVYDGIGSGDYHAIGGVARLKVPLN
jgi:outer membrane autotransporter protein